MPAPLGNIRELVARYGPKSLVLFLGNGPRHQYASVPDILVALKPVLAQALVAKVGEEEREPASFVAVYGGDTFVPDKPDLGAVMHAIKEEYDISICSVQGWDQTDEHVDHVYMYEISRSPEGREQYGGFDHRSGEKLGGSAVYLGEEWLEQTRAIVAIEPRGRVGTQELKYAQELNAVPVLLVPAVPRFADGKASEGGSCAAEAAGDGESAALQ